MLLLTPRKKKFALAEKQLVEAYQIASDLQFNTGLGLTLVAWGECSYEQKQYQRALQKLQEAKHVLGKNGELEIQISCYRNLSLNYEAIGDYKSAFENHKIFQELKDSIYQEESFNTITELETKYQVQQKESDINLLKNRARIREKAG